MKEAFESLAMGKSTPLILTAARSLTVTVLATDGQDLLGTRVTARSSPGCVVSHLSQPVFVSEMRCEIFRGLGDENGNSVMNERHSRLVIGLNRNFRVDEGGRGRNSSS